MEPLRSSGASDLQLITFKRSVVTPMSYDWTRTLMDFIVHFEMRSTLNSWMEEAWNLYFSVALRSQSQNLLDVVLDIIIKIKKKIRLIK
jgi:hypothetical protein